MFNSLDYTMGKCRRCGKELFVHNDERLCLVCQYDKLSEEVAILREELEKERRDMTKMLAEIARMRKVEDDGK